MGKSARNRKKKKAFQSKPYTTITQDIPVVPTMPVRNYTGDKAEFKNLIKDELIVYNRLQSNRTIYSVQLGYMLEVSCSDILEYKIKCPKTLLKKHDILNRIDANDAYWIMREQYTDKKKQSFINCLDYHKSEVHFEDEGLVKTLTVYIDCSSLYVIQERINSARNEYTIGGDMFRNGAWVYGLSGQEVYDVLQERYNRQK